MAHNESSDSEFDQEMERVLREHFSAETRTCVPPTTHGRGWKAAWRNRCPNHFFRASWDS